jgi:dienelactone hydrolase
VRRLGLLTALLVAAAGCGADSHPAASKRATPAPTAAPALFAVARGDRYVPVRDMRAVARRVRASTKRVIVLPAVAGHGWELLTGTATEWSPLAATVAAFIRRHAAGRRK